MQDKAKRALWPTPTLCRAANLANNILSNPATRSFDAESGVTTIRNEAGQGVRFNEETTSFVGFVDPEIRQ